MVTLSADLVSKEIAYLIDIYRLVRQRIEDLFKDGKITALFCTSTLIRHPADNLFIRL